MVFTYFIRARFAREEFTVFNFYLALYLASDIEEDIDEYKYEIFPWALGPKWRSKFSGFLKKRDALLRRIGYRAIVSRKCCEEVMGFVADHYAWKRERSEDHGGATRAYLITRGRRLLSSRSNLEEDELNLPRGPHEQPRPCPLCFLSRPETKLNHTKYIVPATPSHGFKPKLSAGLFPFPTYSNFMCDADENDSNTSGYVSNESHASSNLSTYSAESSFYSTSAAVDWTIRKKDDLKSDNNSTLKQVNTPKLNLNTNTKCLKKDLTKPKHVNKETKIINNKKTESYFISKKSEFEAMTKKLNDSNRRCLPGDKDINECESVFKRYMKLLEGFLCEGKGKAEEVKKENVSELSPIIPLCESKLDKIISRFDDEKDFDPNARLVPGQLDLILSP